MRLELSNQQLSNDNLIETINDAVNLDKIVNIFKNEPQQVKTLRELIDEQTTLLNHYYDTLNIKPDTTREQYIDNLKDIRYQKS